MTGVRLVYEVLENPAVRPRVVFLRGGGMQRAVMRFSRDSGGAANLTSNRR